MNLRALQKHLIVVIAGTVFVVALGGIIWLWQRAATEKTDIVSQLEDQQSQLNSLLGTKPAPSPENIEALKRERDQVAQLFAKLQEGTLRPHLIVTNLVRDIQFTQLLGETVPRLTSMAIRNRVKTTDNFRFGFGRYETEFPCKQAGVTPEDCKKTLELLGKQLLAIEKLGTLLMESHVDEIVRIRRTEVDPGGQNPDALDVPITTDPKGLYQSYPFEFEFVCETKALRDFLNSLANAEQIFIVRVVKIDSATTVVTTGGTAPAAGRPTDAVTSTEPTQTSEHRRLTVTVRVDLVEFIPATPPAKESP
jgi:hypothetical protein